MRTKAALGRTLGPGDARLDAAPVALSRFHSSAIHAPFSRRRGESLQHLLQVVVAAGARLLSSLLLYVAAGLVAQCRGKNGK